MFSLIIVIVSIILVGLISLAVVYQGGSSFSQRSPEALAASLITQGEQIAGAILLRSVDTSAPLLSLADLAVDNGRGAYLSALPYPIPSSYAGGVVPSTLDWVILNPSGSKPAFMLRNKVRRPVCEEINSRSLGTPTIAADANTAHPVQCFGSAEPFTVLYSGKSPNLGTDIAAYNAANPQDIIGSNNSGGNNGGGPADPPQLTLSDCISADGSMQAEPIICTPGVPADLFPSFSRDNSSYYYNALNFAFTGAASSATIDASHDNLSAFDSGTPGSFGSRPILLSEYLFPFNPVTGARGDTPVILVNASVVAVAPFTVGPPISSNLRIVDTSTNQDFLFPIRYHRISRGFPVSPLVFEVSQPSQTKTVVFTNSNSFSAAITNLSVQRGANVLYFRENSSTCDTGITLSPGQSCTLTITSNVFPVPDGMDRFEQQGGDVSISLTPQGFNVRGPWVEVYTLQHAP